MNTQSNHILMQAWKQQVDGCLRTIETLVEGATKLREMQLEAAADAHADLEATRRAIAATTDPVRVFEMQAQWARANAEKCATYWRKFYELAAQTQAGLAQCMVPPPAAATPAATDDSKQALLTLIDSAYRQWLDTAEQFYKLPAMRQQGRRETRAQT